MTRNRMPVEIRQRTSHVGKLRSDWPLLVQAGDSRLAFSVEDMKLVPRKKAGVNVELTPKEDKMLSSLETIVDLLTLASRLLSSRDIANTQKSPRQVEQMLLTVMPKLRSISRGAHSKATHARKEEAASICINRLTRMMVLGSLTEVRYGTESFFNCLQIITTANSIRPAVVASMLERITR